MAGGKMSLDARTISDVQASNAAAIIDAHISRHGDHAITADDLKKTRDLLARHHKAVESGKAAKSPIVGWGISVDTLEAGLPALEKSLQATQIPRGKDKDAFCVYMPTSVVRNPGTQTCASLIATRFVGGAVGSGDGKNLDINSVTEARRYWKAMQTANFPDGFDHDTVAALRAEPNFNDANLTAIELFMHNGNNGLVNYGPLWIHNKCYPVVFRMPDDTSMSKADFTGRVAAYETQFARTGYDRIYFVDEHTPDTQHLYVALSSRHVVDKQGVHISRVNDIDELTPGHLGDEKNVRERVHVIKVTDVDNNVLEASVGVLTDTVNKISDEIQRKLQDRLQRGLESMSAPLEPGSSKEEETRRAEMRAAVKEAAAKRKMLSTALSVTGITAVAGVVAAIPAAIPYLSVAIAGLIAFKVATMWLVGKDVRPVYAALGIPVTRPNKVKF